LIESESDLFLGSYRGYIPQLLAKAIKVLIRSHDDDHNRSTNQPTNQSTNQPTNQPTNERDLRASRALWRPDKPPHQTPKTSSPRQLPLSQDVSHQPRL